MIELQAKHAANIAMSIWGINKKKSALFYRRAIVKDDDPLLGLVPVHGSTVAPAGGAGPVLVHGLGPDLKHSITTEAAKTPNYVTSHTRSSTSRHWHIIVRYLLL